MIYQFLTLSVQLLFNLDILESPQNLSNKIAMMWSYSVRTARTSVTRWNVEGQYSSKSPSFLPLLKIDFARRSLQPMWKCLPELITKAMYYICSRLARLQLL